MSSFIKISKKYFYKKKSKKKNCEWCPKKKFSKICKI